MHEFNSPWETAMHEFQSSLAGSLGLSYAFERLERFIKAEPCSQTARLITKLETCATASASTQGWCTGGTCSPAPD